MNGSWPADPSHSATCRCIVRPPNVSTMAGHDLGALGAALDARARSDGMSGVVSVDVDGDPVFAASYGMADRAHGIRNTVDDAIRHRERQQGLHRARRDVSSSRTARCSSTRRFAASWATTCR